MRALFIGLFLLASTAAGAQDAELIGGTVADPKDWPASPWVGNCSSTLVGERVLITAAHCVSNGGSKTFQIGTTRYSAKCDHHPSYRGNSTADWALCLVDKAVPEIVFESVLKPAEFACARGVKFLWTGYGCTRWGGGIDGKFRTGEVSAISCPSGTNYDTVTKGSVALCSGDSGGGGYLVVNGVRRYVGTNSRSNTTDTSYVSTFSAQNPFDWGMGWLKAKNTWACGMSSEAPAGRCKGDDSTPPPPPPPPGQDCARELQDLEDSAKAVTSATAAVKACLSAE